MSDFGVFVAEVEECGRVGEGDRGAERGETMVVSLGKFAFIGLDEEGEGLPMSVLSSDENRILVFLGAVVIISPIFLQKFH